MPTPAAPAIDGATHLHSGKVRDLYELPDGRLLMVASDRISAFDFVLDTTDPRQGRDPHPDVAVVVRAARRPGAAPRALDRRPGRGRAAARSSASGSTMYPGRVRRPRLPHRLRAARLPRHRRGLRHRAAGRARGRQPAARADLHPGHQGRRSASTTRTSRTTPWSATVGADAAAELRDADPGGLRAGPRRSPASAASSWPTPSSSSGAAPDGTIVLADEVLTPDSSRFWPADEWQPGRAQPSYDKQIVRDWLLSPASGWDRASGEAAAAAARRGRRAHPGALPRGLRDADRPALVTTPRESLALPSPMSDFTVTARAAAPAGGALPASSPTPATARSGSPACARSPTSTRASRIAACSGATSPRSASSRGWRSPS